MRFFNVSFRLNLEQFFPNDSLVYDVFGLFQCKLSKTGNLVLFHRNSHKDEDAGHLRCTETCKTQKVVAHSSGLQKLENSNLKILKFEARFAYAVKFWTDFFDLKSAKFSPYDILSKTGNLLLFQCTLHKILHKNLLTKVKHNLKLISGYLII